MKTILFQGDSITDCDRNREYSESRGNGYATVVAATLGYKYPGEYKFLNRGIGGNRVVDVYARIKNHILNIKPDYMSILVGVNDVWHELEIQNGINTEKYIKIYSMLISEIKEELPDTKIMILEPFVLDGTATHENIEYFRSEVADKAKASKRIAEDFNLSFIPLQKYFDEMVKRAPEGYWSVDGVHPTTMGHGIIASKWIEEFEKIK